MGNHARFMENEVGATAIEYGLIAVGIALVLVAALPTIADKLTATYQEDLSHKQLD